MRPFSVGVGLLALCNQFQLGSAAPGIDIDPSNKESVKAAAKIVAKGLVDYYKPHSEVGLMPQPYYWWIGGAMFGQLIEYWKFTGDDQYNQMVTEGMLNQIGENKNYEPIARKLELGNDDQAFWAFAALTAAELKFPEPSKEYPSWVALAQAAFSKQVSRWSNRFCGGGLHWQIFEMHQAFDYKNTISNGGFFQMAARLARYTGNETYVEWAERSYDWLWNVGFINHENYYVYDGAHGNDAYNCTDINKMVWSYNIGVMLSGSAFMYNHTKSAKWRARVDRFLAAAYDRNFPAQYGGNILIEPTCEDHNTCNWEQPSFKSYLARWMGVAGQLVPDLQPAMAPKFAQSSLNAASSCQGVKADGTTLCGRDWKKNTFDGNMTVGTQMSALAVMIGNLYPYSPAPVTESTGGLSKNDGTAGTRDYTINDIVHRTITMGDKVGAGIVTTLMLAATIGTGYALIR